MIWTSLQSVSRCPHVSRNLWPKNAHADILVRTGDYSWYCNEPWWEFLMNDFKLHLFFDFNGFCMILWSPIDGCWSKMDQWGIIKPPVHVFKIKSRIKIKCYLFNWLLNCIKLVLNDIKWFIFELFLKNKNAIFGLKIALFQWLNGLMIPFRQVVNSLKKLHFRQKNNIKKFFLTKIYGDRDIQWNSN